MWIYGKASRLCESIREEMSLDPSDASNVYMFMSRNRKVVKILHYERGFYVLYEKRPVMGKFKKPVFDEVSKCYRIQWSDMAYLTESIVVDRMYVSRPLKSPFLKVCRNTRCTFFGHKKEGANFDTPSSVFYSLSVHYPINRNTGEINQRLYIRVAS